MCRQNAITTIQPNAYAEGPNPDVERGKKSGCGLDRQHPENNDQRILGAGQGLHHGDGNAETDGCAKRDQLTG